MLLAVTLLRVDVASQVAFVLVTLLAALCFGLIGYALRLALGGPGVAVFVLFLLVQVAALGNVVPLETAPGALQQANGLMPLTAFTNATSQVVSGGDVGSLQAATLVLVVWAAAAYGVSVLLVKRQRVRRPTTGPAVVAGTAA